jgi:hypothetical protein
MHPLESANDKVQQPAVLARFESGKPRFARYITL